MATRVLTTEEYFEVTLAPLSANQGEANLDTQDQTPRWSQNGDLLLIPSADGLTGQVWAGSTTGSFQVTIDRADADLDAGEIRELDPVVIDVIVTLPEAQTLGVTLGPNQLKPV